MERDWLKTITGILALGFGIYCLALFAMLQMRLEDVSGFTPAMCLIYGTIYLVYGASLLLKKGGSRFHFLAFVFMFSFGFGGMPWYFWPLFIMPIIILVLTIWMFLRIFMGRNVKVEKW